MSRKILSLLSFPLILSLLLTACAPAAKELYPMEAPPKEEVLVAPTMAVRSFSAVSGEAYPEAAGVLAPGAAPAPPEAERLVVKNANLSLVVDDPAKSLNAISKMAEEMKGYVVSANLYETELESGAKVPRGSITIRVPAERFTEALDRIRQESKQIPLTENISSQDVTREYTDLQSRLRNLEAAEAQLKEIMASATKTEDVLNVYQQLVQVREQIEVIKGQMQYYEQSAALSAISVELIANEAVQPLRIGTWQPVGTAKNAVQALINTLQFLARVLIWLALYVFPVLVVLYLLIGLPLTLLFRSWRKRRAKAKQTPPPATAG
jgi:hypothetical protein